MNTGKRMMRQRISFSYKVNKLAEKYDLLTFIMAKMKK